MSAVLEARAVSKRFQIGGGMLAKARTLHAVSSVSLSLGEREVLGLVGESGCGKSTLAKMLLGLEPPSEGEIRLADQPIRALSRKRVARLVQPVFQDPYSSLNPRATVGDTIARPLRVHGLARRDELRDRVLQVMESVGLPSRLYASYPSQMSGGQRQRVAIARALVLEPEILLCDEPTSALDVSVQAQILNLLTELQKNSRIALLFISHNLRVVEYLSDRIAVMYLGRIVEVGPTRAIFARPRHPYTRALIASALDVAPGQGIPDVGLGTASPNPMDVPSGCPFHPRCPMAAEICTRERPLLTLKDGVEAACHFA